MTKQASPPEASSPNYPDVLGALTGGARVNIDLLQAAVAARPAEPHAGQTFDAIILLQNAANIELDAVVRMILPEKDLGGKPGRITSKVTKALRIGLRSGEVGFASLPVHVDHSALPGEGYALNFEIQVEHKGRNPARVRDANGGAPYTPQKPIFDVLRGLNFSVETVKGGLARALAGGNKSTLIAPFLVLPPTISGLPEDRRPDYVTLWLESDFDSGDAPLAAVKPKLDALLPQLNRYTSFFPLLRYTQERFESARYRLWAGEAVMIAKLMSLVLEMGSPVTVAGQDAPSIPRWYTRLAQVVASQPELADQEHIPTLVTQSLYPELIFDGAILAFTTLGTITNEDFGTADEMADYTNHLIELLTGAGGALEISRAYLPLILGGLVVHPRVLMPQEQAHETVQLLVRAIQKRSAEQNDQNSFVFDIAHDLIRRAEA